MMGPNSAPLISWRGAAIAVLLGCILCWPILLSGGIYTFPDTPSYLRGGQFIWNFLGDLAGGWITEAPSTTPTGDAVQSALSSAAADDGKGPIVVRSIAYSFFSFSLFAVGGVLLLAIAQGSLVVFSAFAMVGPFSEYRLPALFAATAMMMFATALPWFSVYLMPDILVAVIVIHAAILVRRFDDFTTAQKVVLTALASFAVAAHYGNPPLALGLFAVAILWRVLRRRWSKAAFVAALVPIMLTPLANYTISWATLDRPSASPLRLPILLARSLDDGPARWYLEEACPAANLAVCVLFRNGSPESIRDFLWSETGIEGLPRETVQQIVDEEYTVLLRAFLSYPLQQTASLLGNATSQLTKLGLGDLQFKGALNADLTVEPPADPEADADLKRLAQIAIVVSTWGSLAVLLLAWAARRTTRAETEVIAIVLLGFLLNAFIFGGLSAPADRYQARVSWLLPLLASLILVRRRPSTDA